VVGWPTALGYLFAAPQQPDDHVTADGAT